MNLCNVYLKEAEELLEAGHVAQAAWKVREAVEEAIKHAAMVRGWPERDPFNILRKLSDESGDRELAGGLVDANLAAEFAPLDGHAAEAVRLKYESAAALVKKLSLLAGSAGPAEEEDLQQHYMALSDRYLADGAKLLELHDYPQASEKYWGAVATLINAVAAVRGWQRSSHYDLQTNIGSLYRETGDQELPTLFAVAARLHANFYQDFLSAEEVTLHAGQAMRLTEKLRLQVGGADSG